MEGKYSTPEERKVVKIQHGEIVCCFVFPASQQPPLIISLCESLVSCWPLHSSNSLTQNHTISSNFSFCPHTITSEKCKYDSSLRPPTFVMWIQCYCQNCLFGFPASSPVHCCDHLLTDLFLPIIVMGHSTHFHFLFSLNKCLFEQDACMGQKPADRAQPPCLVLMGTFPPGSCTLLSKTEIFETDLQV